MANTCFRRLKGSKFFSERLLLSTLSATPIIIEDIRHHDSWPGLRAHEVSLLRLIEKISDDCEIVINETGTKLKYKPGVVIGGKNLIHDCGVSRAIGYFLQPLLVLGLFGKRPLSIRLKGITNDSRDPSVDTFQMVTLPMLKRFDVPKEGLALKIESRGAPPLGGGEVVLAVPSVPNCLSATIWIEEGMVKSIRGVTFTTRVSPQFENRMIHAARGVFNSFIPDVHIYTDHKSGPFCGRSPGYGISLVAETTTGCFISADSCVKEAQESSIYHFEDNENKTDLVPPEDLGIQVSSTLLEEIEKGGIVDTTHQGLLFLLCALCPQDVSKVRVGILTPHGIEMLRHIRDFLGVTFDIKHDATTNTVVSKCVGCGMKNISRKVS